MTERELLIGIRERTLLVGLEIHRSRPLLSVEDSLTELALLADTAGMEVVGQTWQKVAHPDPATFVGSGKVDEIKDMLLASEASRDLRRRAVARATSASPRKRFSEEVKVLDRSALILDAYSPQHAHTREGSLQVELAQYEYRLPRLTRAWTHLARQAGSASGRGGAGGNVGLPRSRRDPA
ncbi:MAG: hypothetical protein U0521_07000 [Anaerolineae bacterium]